MVRTVSFVVSGEKIVIVDAEVTEGEPIQIVADFTWTLQKGDRSAALNTASMQVQNYLREHHVEKVLVKASAVTKGAVRLVYLHSAELRGVVIAAAASVCDVSTPSKAAVSKTFGKRKVDEYVADDKFWEDNVVGHRLRGGSREAAMLILAERD